MVQVQGGWAGMEGGRWFCSLKEDKLGNTDDRWADVGSL